MRQVHADKCTGAKTAVRAQTQGPLRGEAHKAKSLGGRRERRERRRGVRGGRRVRGGRGVRRGRGGRREGNRREEEGGGERRREEGRSRWEKGKSRTFTLHQG